MDPEITTLAELTHTQKISQGLSHMQSLDFNVYIKIYKCQVYILCPCVRFVSVCLHLQAWAQTIKLEMGS